jgi:hypothetical protein
MRQRSDEEGRRGEADLTTVHRPCVLSFSLSFSLCAWVFNLQVGEWLMCET